MGKTRRRNKDLYLIGEPIVAYLGHYQGEIPNIKAKFIFDLAIE